MRRLISPHPPGHLAKGGALQEPAFDNQSRGGINAKRAKQAQRRLAAVPRPKDPWGRA